MGRDATSRVVMLTSGGNGDLGEVDGELSGVLSSNHGERRKRDGHGEGAHLGCGYESWMPTMVINGVCGRQVRRRSQTQLTWRE